MKITSTAFKDGEDIPAIYSCDGRDMNPPLVFENIPDQTKSLTLIVDDPDASAGSANPGWVHWILFNIAPDNNSIIENSSPEDAIDGVHDWGRARYGGPCPPTGTHHYIHTLYALDVELDFPMPPTKGELIQAMDGHILDSAVLMGLFTRN